MRLTAGISKTYAPLVESGSSRLHVVPSLSGGWTVREIPDGPSLRRTNTRRGALDFATDSLHRGRGGSIHLHDPDGTVVGSYQVAARGPRPWWYSPPRLGLLLTSVFLAIEGVFFAVSSTRLLHWVGWTLLVVGVLQVTLFAASKRADRRSREAQTPSSLR